MGYVDEVTGKTRQFPAGSKIVGQRFTMIVLRQEDVRKLIENPKYLEQLLPRLQASCAGGSMNRLTNWYYALRSVRNLGLPPLQSLRRCRARVVGRGEREAPVAGEGRMQEAGFSTRRSEEVNQHEFESLVSETFAETNRLLVVKGGGVWRAATTASRTSSGEQR